MNIQTTIYALILTATLSSCDTFNSEIDNDLVQIDDSTRIYTYKENNKLVDGTVVTNELDPKTGKKYKASVRDVKNGKRINKGYDYFPDGKIGNEWPYADGLLNGEAKSYYDNGQVYQITNYKDNKEDGVMKEFDDAGGQILEIVYERGNKIKEYKFDKNGSKILPPSEKLKIISIQTGYDPYHNMSNLFLPCIAVKFQNNSGKDINDFIKVTAIFIDNSKNEQIATEYSFLTSNSEPFLNGASKQIRLASERGWYAVQNQDISVKLYLGDELIKTLSVDKREFNGMIQ